jgi:peptidoglycan L-alanyl-D-glutamate endopeptidase CwlK
LDTRLVPTVLKIYDMAWKERIPMYVLWGSRSIEEQNLLHRFGRTLPGEIHTTKRGGYSAHNYGFALDFTFVGKDGFIPWERIHRLRFWKAKWAKIVNAFEAEGWEVGWRWPNYEPGHVQNLLGNTIGDLYRQYDQSIEDRYSGFENL